MGLGGEKEIRKITGRQLLEFARGVDGEHVLEAARTMARLMPFAFSAAAADARATAAISVQDQRWLNSTNERLSEHAQHVETMLERTA